MAGIFSLFKRDRVETKEATIPFKGFDLCYSEGTSIVERYKSLGHYEQDFVDVLVRYLGDNSAVSFVDIGANIGMISLSLLEKLKDLKIYAFEPGPHQADLFERTIQMNNLSKKIELSRIALKDQKGFDFFHVHKTMDVSGDGFIDTERAGKTRKIKVETDTFDNWWKSRNKPDIKYVKMDTEGSEYWILKGAQEFITQCKPILFIEINDKNIRNYPFKIDDLINYIESFGYEIKTLEEEAVDKENIVDKIKLNDTFIVCPKS